MAEQLYVIRSIKNDQHRPKGDEAATWWGPDSRGYTSDLSQAGKYTLEEAKKICDPNQEIRFEGKGKNERQYPEELMVPLELASELAQLNVNKYSLENALRRRAEAVPS